MDNEEQIALLESAKDKLKMATIERKRMSSINAESRSFAFNKKSREALAKNTSGGYDFGAGGKTIDVPRRQSRFNDKKKIEMIEIEDFI